MPALKWNPAAQRFVNSAGRFIDPRTVRAAVDADLQAREQRIQAAAANLDANDPAGVDAWAAALRQNLKDAHLAHGLAAVGGRKHASQADYGAIGQRLAFHYGRLDAAAADVKAGRYGDDPASNAQFQRRLSWFSAAPRNTFERLSSQGHVESGFGYVRNVYGATERHCTSRGDKIGCTELTAKGRMPADEWVEPGDRSCGPECDCHAEWFKSPK